MFRALCFLEHLAYLFEAETGSGTFVDDLNNVALLYKVKNFGPEHQIVRVPLLLRNTKAATEWSTNAKPAGHTI